MKKITFLLICSLFLVSCSSGSIPFTNSHVIIDWVDFIKFNGEEYLASHSKIVADPNFIKKEIGQVKFKVADNISNPSYQTKNGDAAFWEKGTQLFAIQGLPGFLAVKDDTEINGYRIYHSDEAKERNAGRFQDIDKDSITRIEIYKGYSKPQMMNVLSDEQQINQFMNLLNSSKTKPGFSPDTASGDPTMYQMIFYSDQPVAHKYHLYFDGTVWYWHPWDTAIIENEIKHFVKKQLQDNN